MYGTLLGDSFYLHDKPLRSYCQCNVHCNSTSKWYFKILVILIGKGDINISSPLPQRASRKKKKCTQIKMVSNSLQAVSALPLPCQTSQQYGWDYARREGRSNMV